MKENLPGLIELVASIALALLTLLAARAKKYLDRKADRDDRADILFQVGEAVFAAVKNIGQAYVNDLKLAAADGKLTEIEKSRARNAALQEAKKQLGSKLLAQLAELFSLDTPTAIDDFLFSKIESAVALTKERGLSNMLKIVPVPLGKIEAEPSAKGAS
jgi:hypothetical protein